VTGLGQCRDGDVGNVLGLVGECLDALGDQVKMSEIAGLSQISIGSLYQYFPRSPIGGGFQAHVAA
jgi:hypothetical protein